jgi:hypothetical protein
MPNVDEVEKAPVVKIDRPSLREYTRTNKADIDDRVTRVTEP